MLFLATTCSPVGRGTLLSLNDSDPTAWTQYTFNYTATRQSTMIMFGFQNENNREYYLDDVSVVDNGSPSIELLQNPGFENSTTSVTDWLQWCLTSCGSGSSGTVTFGSNCFSGNCFVDNCYASAGIDFLAQTFNTTFGQTYTISFRLKLGGAGTTTGNRFYADII